MIRSNVQIQPARFGPFRTRAGIAVALLVILGLTSSAWAHKKHLSRSRWRVRAAEGLVGMTAVFESSDLALTIDLMGLSPDLKIGSDARREAVRDRVWQTFRTLLPVTNDDHPCRMIPLRVLRKRGYEVGLRWECPGPIGRLRVEMNWLERLPPDHRQLATFDLGVGKPTVHKFRLSDRVFEATLPKTAAPTARARPLAPRSAPAPSAPDPDRPRDAQETPASPQPGSWIPLLGILGGLALFVGLGLIRRSARHQQRDAPES